jgi:hypothetical protein
MFFKETAWSGTSEAASDPVYGRVLGKNLTPAGIFNYIFGVIITLLA